MRMYVQTWIALSSCLAERADCPTSLTSLQILRMSSMHFCLHHTLLEDVVCYKSSILGTNKGRFSAFFIDNCTAHPKVQDLQSIELFFLPPNTTSEIQPCNQGIINALKAHYRKMVNQLIQAIDGESTLAEFRYPC